MAQKKKYLVIYDEAYIKPRLEKIERLKQYCDFSYKKTKDRTIKPVPEEFDGVCYVFDGEWLEGKYGNHQGVNGKSLIRVESKKDYNRKWTKDGKRWYLKGTRGRGDYPQLEYTFEHEIAHSLAFLYGKTTLPTLLYYVLKMANRGQSADGLHTYVDLKKYEEWWTDIGLPTNKEYPEKLLPLVERRWKVFEAIMSVIDPIQMVEGFRDCEKQNQYYREGKSKAKCGESMHQYGVAIDYCFKKSPAYPKSQSKRWLSANTIAQALGFYSYGINDGWDDGHIQLMLDYKSERDLIKNFNQELYK